MATERGISTFGFESTDKEESSTGIEESESAKNEVTRKDYPKQSLGSLEDMSRANTRDLKGGKNVSQGAVLANEDASGDVNMEASISFDDAVRAGGLGARDDIGSFLPVASDSTDFEASLLDARDYEETDEKKCRPGLGWTEATK